LNALPRHREFLIVHNHHCFLKIPYQWVCRRGCTGY
jgi:hypothetical protein